MYSGRLRPSQAVSGKKTLTRAKFIKKTACFNPPSGRGRRDLIRSPHCRKERRRERLRPAKQRPYGQDYAARLKRREEKTAESLARLRGSLMRPSGEFRPAGVSRKGARRGFGGLQKWQTRKCGAQFRAYWGPMQDFFEKRLTNSESSSIMIFAVKRCFSPRIDWGMV